MKLYHICLKKNTHFFTIIVLIINHGITTQNVFEPVVLVNKCVGTVYKTDIPVSIITGNMHTNTDPD